MGAVGEQDECAGLTTADTFFAASLIEIRPLHPAGLEIVATITPLSRGRVLELAMRARHAGSSSR